MCLNAKQINIFGLSISTNFWVFYEFEFGKECVQSINDDDDEKCVSSNKF